LENSFSEAEASVGAQPPAATGDPAPEPAELDAPAELASPVGDEPVPEAQEATPAEEAIADVLEEINKPDEEGPDEQGKSHFFKYTKSKAQRLMQSHDLIRKMTEI